MRHVGEQQAADAVRGLELRVPGRQVGGHAIESRRERGQFVGAAFIGARIEVADAVALGHLLETGQPAPDRTEDETAGDGRGQEQQDGGQHPDLPADELQP